MSTPKDSHESLGVTLFPRIERRAHPRIDYYFDASIHIVRRSKELAWESKELIVTLLMVLLLVLHSYHVLTK
jgi:hypothetical protein